MEVRNYKFLWRRGPSIWSLATLEQGYNRKTKSEKKEESLAKMGWSDGGDNTRRGLAHQKLISAKIKSGLNTTNWQEHISPYIKPANLILASSIRCFARLVTAENPYWKRRWMINLKERPHCSKHTSYLCQSFLLWNFSPPKNIICICWLHIHLIMIDQRFEWLEVILLSCWMVPTVMAVFGSTS